MTTSYSCVVGTSCSIGPVASFAVSDSSCVSTDPLVYTVKMPSGTAIITKQTMPSDVLNIAFTPVSANIGTFSLTVVVEAYKGVLLVMENRAVVISVTVIDDPCLTSFSFTSTPSIAD